MTTIVTRAGKGSSLSWSEGDANFTNLNNDKLEASDLIASNITNTPSGSISAVTVQTAINELDVAKAPIDAPTFTNTVTSPRNYNVSGTLGALQVGGVDVVTYDSTGIKAGSYKAGSIVAADFADGALIENAPVGIGYGPGAGGTVIQATSKLTAVTLNKPCGRITTHNATIGAGGAGASATFFVNNSLVGANDVVVASIYDLGNANSDIYHAYCRVAEGGFVVFLANKDVVAHAETVGINFAVIKGAIS